MTSSHKTPPDSSGEVSDESVDQLPPGKPTKDLAAETLASVRRYANTRPSSATSRRRRGPGQFTGSGSDERDPQLVGPTLAKMVRDQGWEHRSAVGGVLGRWPEIAGSDLADHVEPESFDDDQGRLVLRAESTTWATQVRMLIPMLQQRLDQEVGVGVVRSIDVLGPAVSGPANGRRWVKGRGSRDTFG